MSFQNLKFRLSQTCKSKAVGLLDLSLHASTGVNQNKCIRSETSRLTTEKLFVSDAFIYLSVASLCVGSGVILLCVTPV